MLFLLVAVDDVVVSDALDATVPPLHIGVGWTSDSVDAGGGQTLDPIRPDKVGVSRWLHCFSISRALADGFGCPDELVDLLGKVLDSISDRLPTDDET